MLSAVLGYGKTFAVLALLACGAGGIQAQDAPSTRVKQQKKDRNVKAGEKEAKKLILLMDKDQDGKVSREEFTAFMQAEFDRLDIDKNGLLDVAELTQARVQTSSGHNR
jgi:Ca2+-binding EF-hand superfamily protein